MCAGNDESEGCPMERSLDSRWHNGDGA